MKSIRIRLLVFVLLGFTVIWASAALVAYSEAKHEVEELFDAEMAQSAQVLLTLTLHEIEEGDTDTVELQHQIGGHPYVTKLAFQVWNNNSLLFHSDSAPTEMLSFHLGYSDQTINGRRWRVFVLEAYSKGYSVQVGQLYEVRDELVREIAWSLNLPMLLVLPVMVLFLWLGIGRGLMPLRRVADEVGRRSAHDMTPLSDGNTPKEIKPLTLALNRLLQQLRSALERERRFTSDAAHELRTPLASIKTQAQVAGRSENAGERNEALKNIGAGVDRATHLVEQLLTLARLEPSDAAAEFKPVNLCQITEDVIAEMALAAHDKQIDIGMNDCGAIMLSGNPLMLSVLIRNLIDNAIRYTPDGGSIDVEVVQKNNQAILSVTDTGPGVPEAHRTQVLERFYRGEMEDQKSGCGLGLSIVKRIAELHDASLVLDQPETGQGLYVSISFPLALDS